ncbi:MAG: heme ABC exporter ATP-binding protein CcmA [Rhodospirillaceae bacterium]|nr:MAG: heme ABC exporter ATP-binding protein CcmA [Rhodospirillaceae bacterium]
MPFPIRGLCYGPGMGAEGFEPTTFSGTGLACRRGGHSVFAGLDFAVGSGQVLVLRGANGSGKTTLLRLMAGLANLSTGILSWDGIPIDHDPEAHGIRTRLVGHQDGVKSGLTVAENLTFAANLQGGAPEAAIQNALHRFGLGRLADLPGRVLSAGQRHRLALARLLVVPAPLWLLDEPTNALDEEAFATLSAVIADHRTKGGMVVVASHGTAPTTDAVALDLGRFTATPAPHWSDAA